MKPLSKRLVVGGTVFGVALAISGTSLLRRSVAFAQSTATSSKPQMSEQAFKNIKVLKGIPVDEFMGTMGLFSAALSVCCGDCHTGAGTDHPDWAADPPRKLVARRMVEMVNAINKANFNGRQQVTCWTCHRGAQAPQTTPTIDAIYSTPVFTPPDILPAANPATSGTPPADEILTKYVQALGGADKLAALKSYVEKRKSKLFDEVNTDQTEIYAKSPLQLSVLVHEREGDLARVYDGANGWVMLPLTVVKKYPLTASALEGAKLDAQMAFPGALKGFFKNWKVTYPTSIDGEDVYVLQGTDPGGLVATFYFDKKSFLLRRLVHYSNSAVGRYPVQFDYSDYRPVAGVKMPFKFTYGWLSGREEYNIKEIQPNVAVDNAKFAEPQQRAK